MGDEISSSIFKQSDYAYFEKQLRYETDHFTSLYEQNAFANAASVAGFEIEAWLIGQDFKPSPSNELFIQQLNSPLVCVELAKFNVELNGDPLVLRGGALRQMQTEMQHTWKECKRVSKQLSTDIVMIGILPTLMDQDLVPANMSDMERYRALNQQVLRLREGVPLHLDIVGNEHLKVQHADVMLEAAATSFQIHLQVAQSHAVRAYNASLVVSAPMVALSANSPYLFGKDLWDETRIPLFEQAVELGGFAAAARGPLRRVTFGSDYVQQSISELFVENMEHYPVLLPIRYDDPPEQMRHLRLHNGTIWRWNRPLVGIDQHDQMQLRIEHRVVSAGPTIIDEIANAAFYYGLVHFLSQRSMPPELQLSFPGARDNFYTAARKGLDAQLKWLNGRKIRVQTLILEDLLPMAKSGLEALQIDASDIDAYLGIIEQRVSSACNGAAWQRAYVAKHGRDMAKLLTAYCERQSSGEPVHQWSI